MKHIYIEVSEDMYSDAKRIGFFEVKEFLRIELGKFVIAQDGVAQYDNSRRT